MTLSDADIDQFVTEPERPGEELLRESTADLLEGIAEDRIPRGTSIAHFLGVLSYAVAKKATGFGPFAVLGADPSIWAKYVARAIYAGIGGLASNRAIPKPFFALIRSLGPMTGGLKGVLDGLRRDTIRQLGDWAAITDPVAREAGMQPSLGVAEGLVELKWAKISGKTAALPSAATAKDRKEGPSVFSGLPGTGSAMYIRDYLAALERTATTDEAKQGVETMVHALNAFAMAVPIFAADLFEASARGLISPEEIVRVLQLPEGDMVRGELDASGNSVLLSVRQARLNALVREAAKRVKEARLADGTDKPEQVTNVASSGASIVSLGPDMFDLGFAKIPNPARAGVGAALRSAQSVINLQPQADAARAQRYAELRERQRAALKHPSPFQKLRSWLRGE